MKKTIVMTVALAITAFGAFAAPGGVGGGMFGFDPVIAPDGTVLVTRSVTEHEPGSGPMSGEAGMELVAIAPSGAVAWTYASDGGIHDIEIVNGLVVVAVVDGGQYGWWDGVDTEASTTVTALSLATGTVAWDLELEAVVRGLEAADDRIYAISGMHGMSDSSRTRRTTRRPGHDSGHGPGMGNGDGMGFPGEDQQLFAIGLNGTLLWSLDLNE